MKMYRQGDILLVPVLHDISHAAKDIYKLILARGEQTGHKHVMENVQVLIDERDAIAAEDGLELAEELFGRPTIVVDKPTELKHEEHETIMVEPGTYEIRRQRQFDPKQRTVPVVD